MDFGALVREDEKNKDTQGDGGETRKKPGGKILVRA